jgi:hypothetical protein
VLPFLMSFRFLRLILSLIFVFTSFGPIPQAHAQQLLGLPEPGAMVSLSPAYQPTLIKGVTINKDNPFLFDFIVDVGQDKMEGDILKAEGEKLIKYFLAGLAIPDKDLWVNLSPYEKDRTIPEALSQTEMGRDLLAQDYLLKQIIASLIYPEKDLGKVFWDKVYAKAQAQFGTTEIPVNTFNKVWIMADKAEVFERNQTAFVTKAHLKVMLEEDYLALQKNGDRHQLNKGTVPSISSQIIKEIVLPELEKEINEGKNFAPLRQIYNSLILAGWYKNNLKEALINQVYTDKSKVNGINTNDAQMNKAIYERYLAAYKKGVFNYIKEDKSATQTAPRKYFSGGMQIAVNPAMTGQLKEALTDKNKSRLVMISAGLAGANADFKTIVLNQFETVEDAQGKPVTIHFEQNLNNSYATLHLSGEPVEGMTDFNGNEKWLLQGSYIYIARNSNLEIYQIKTSKELAALTGNDYEKQMGALILPSYKSDQNPLSVYIPGVTYQADDAVSGQKLFTFENNTLTLNANAEYWLYYPKDRAIQRMYLGTTKDLEREKILELIDILGNGAFQRWIDRNGNWIRRAGHAFVYKYMSPHRSSHQTPEAIRRRALKIFLAYRGGTLPNGLRTSDKKSKDVVLEMNFLKVMGLMKQHRYQGHEGLVWLEDKIAEKYFGLEESKDKAMSELEEAAWDDRFRDEYFSYTGTLKTIDHIFPRKTNYLASELKTSREQLFKILRQWDGPRPVKEIIEAMQNAISDQVKNLELKEEEKKLWAAFAARMDRAMTTGLETQKRAVIVNALGEIVGNEKPTLLAERITHLSTIIEEKNAALPNEPQIHVGEFREMRLLGWMLPKSLGVRPDAFLGTKRAWTIPKGKIKDTLAWLAQQKSYLEKGVSNPEGTLKLEDQPRFLIKDKGQEVGSYVPAHIIALIEEINSQIKSGNIVKSTGAMSEIFLNSAEGMGIMFNSRLHYWTIPESNLPKFRTWLEEQRALIEKPAEKEKANAAMSVVQARFYFPVTVAEFEKTLKSGVTSEIEKPLHRLISAMQRREFSLDDMLDIVTELSVELERPELEAELQNMTVEYLANKITSNQNVRIGTSLKEFSPLEERTVIQLVMKMESKGINFTLPYIHWLYPKLKEYESGAAEPSSRVVMMTRDKDQSKSADLTTEDFLEMLTHIMEDEPETAKEILLNMNRETHVLDPETAFNLERGIWMGPNITKQIKLADKVEQRTRGTANDLHKLFEIKGWAVYLGLALYQDEQRVGVFLYTEPASGNPKISMVDLEIADLKLAKMVKARIQHNAEYLEDFLERQMGDDASFDFIKSKIAVEDYVLKLARGVFDNSQEGADIGMVAELKQNNPGGIDLSKGTDVTVKSEGSGIEFTIDPAIIEQIKREGIEGLTPVIYRITPFVASEFSFAF